MSNTEQLKQSILTKIDREAKLCILLDEKVDQEWIDKLTEQWIQLTYNDLKQYE